MIKGATISRCGYYRYDLTRWWDNSLPMVTFLMLNPSIADASIDDPTIRRCIGFAKYWGYGGFYVCNLFAYRATNPKDLITANDPVGALNHIYIRWCSYESEKVICSWGNQPILNKLNNNYIYGLLKLVPEYKLYCIDLSKDGTPKHPLYLKKDLKPIKYGLICKKNIEYNHTSI